jgi:LDH2 family malate/lactate/ureidoglycolate dehydrogenase
MPTTSAPDIDVPIDRLLAFGEKMLVAVGVSRDDARLTAEILIEPDLRGVESHGMAHLVDFYVRRFQANGINRTPDLRLTSEAPSAATLDADRALGFLAGHRAMSIAIEKARATGAAWVTVTNSTHYGAGAYYAMMALPHDMIGLSMTTGGRMMAPPGARGAALGTNVFALAAPTPRGFPYVLDMATTVVAAGKLEIARRRGLPIPEGWSVDPEGRPFTNASEAYERGALLPLGGDPVTASFKGFGLGIAVDVLTGVLSGFGASTGTVPGTAAHCVGALRIDAFVPMETYLERAGAMIDALKASETRDGSAVRIPGELEHRLTQERRAAGTVPLHPAILEGFRAAAAELGVPYDLE